MADSAAMLAQSDGADIALAPASDAAPDTPFGYPVPAPAVPRRVFVEHGLALRGALEGCDHLAIAGHVESDIALHSLDILEQGSFKGHATAGEARIAGRYEGVLVVDETLVVGPFARIVGSVQCGRLRLEDGGRIEGDLWVREADTQSAAGLGDDSEFEALLLEAAPSSEADADGADEPMAAGEERHEPCAVEPIELSAAAATDQSLLAEAEAAFRSALKADLGDVAALSGRGHLARQRGDWAAALDYFDLIVAANAGTSSLQRVRANILRALSRDAEADAAASSLTGNPAAQLSLAFPSPVDDAVPADCDSPANLAAASAFDEAEAMFNSVLEGHPRNLGALAGLGHLARRRGDRAAMRKYYGAALAIEPMNVALRVEVARAFKQVGDIAEARQILETVLNDQMSLQRGVLAAG